MNKHVIFVRQLRKVSLSCRIKLKPRATGQAFVIRGPFFPRNWDEVQGSPFPRRFFSPRALFSRLVEAGHASRSNRGLCKYANVYVIKIFHFEPASNLPVWPELISFGLIHQNRRRPCPSPWAVCKFASICAAGHA